MSPPLYCLTGSMERFAFHTMMPSGPFTSCSDAISTYPLAPCVYWQPVMLALLFKLGSSLILPGLHLCSMCALAVAQSYFFAFVNLNGMSELFSQMNFHNCQLLIANRELTASREFRVLLYCHICLYQFCTGQGCQTHFHQKYGCP